MPNSYLHFVFVDFENVQKVDLGLVEGKAVHVTLLLGKNQKKLEMALVQQIHQFADQVELVEVGASGHNALDMTLAYYLGRAIQRMPDAQFTIVSKDKDFEPMISHLRCKGIKVDRCEIFSDAYQPASRKPAAQAKVPVDKLLKLISDFKTKPASRPGRKDKLMHHLQHYFGKKLTEPQLEEKLAELVRRKVLTIDPKGKVSYTV